jgi:uncharacterized membrane protein (UPF0127 family)
MKWSGAPSKAQEGIFYGIVIIAAVAAGALLVGRLDTTDSALTESPAATTTAAETVSGIGAPATTTMPVVAAPSSVSLSDTPAPAMRFEFATTEAAREQGLGDRASVPDDYAMVFAFPKPDQYGFWMKDMEVPLDIVWLSDTGVVLGIEARVPASSYPNVFYPPQPVQYVLEAKAGFMAEHGVGVGDRFPDLPTLPKVFE